MSLGSRKLERGDEKANDLDEWLIEAREKRKLNEHKKVGLEKELYESRLKLQGEHMKPDTVSSSANTIVKPSKRKVPDLKIRHLTGLKVTGRDFGDSFQRISTKAEYLR